MVTKLDKIIESGRPRSVLAKILMVTKPVCFTSLSYVGSVLAKILMVTKRNASHNG